MSQFLQTNYNTFHQNFVLPFTERNQKLKCFKLLMTVHVSELKAWCPQHELGWKLIYVHLISPISCLQSFPDRSDLGFLNMKQFVECVQNPSVTKLWNIFRIPNIFQWCDFQGVPLHIESVVNVHLQLFLCWQQDGATHNGRTLPCCFSTVRISWSGQ